MFNLRRPWFHADFSQIRQSLSDSLPLPSIPNRDFLEKLVSIATKRYKLSAFLQDLPPFIESRLQEWRPLDPRYENPERQPCLQFKHLKAFYQDSYVPRFLQSGRLDHTIEHPSKRQKTRANTQVTRTSDRTVTSDEDVEIPRRTDAPERGIDEEIVRNSSPAPSIDSTQQRSDARIQRSDAGTHIDDTVDEVSALPNDSAVEDFELPINIGSYSSEEDQEEYSLVRKDSPLAIKTGVNTMARRVKQPRDELRTSKDVQDRYDAFVRQFGTNPAVQWLIETARNHQALEAQRKLADAAFTKADQAVASLEESIQAGLPPGKTLAQAISDACEDARNTEDVYNKLVSLKQAAAELLPNVASAGLQGSAQIQFNLNETAAATVRAAKEQRLKDLEDVAHELREKEADRTKKEEEIDRLEDKHAHLTTEQEQVRSLFNMRQDSPTLAALAKLPLPSDT